MTVKNCDLENYEKKNIYLQSGKLHHCHFFFKMECPLSPSKMRKKQKIPHYAHQPLEKFEKN